IFLHQLRREIGIGAQRKGHGQRHPAVSRCLAAHVEHVLDAVDRLFQRRGHRLGDHLRARTRIVGGHHHRRRHHFRVLGNRQQVERDQPAEQDEDRQHPGEDRPVDEELGEVHCCAAWGSRSAPGRTRCKPFTTMRSPDWRPAVTMRWPFAVPPSCTWRQSALLSGPTTMTKRLSWSVPIARSLTSSAGSALARPILMLTYWPGIRLPSRLSNTARTRTVPLFVFTWLSMSCRRPLSWRPPLVTVSASTAMSFFPS